MACFQPPHLHGLQYITGTLTRQVIIKFYKIK